MKIKLNIQVKLEPKKSHYKQENITILIAENSTI